MVGLVLALAAATVFAGAPCRVAFDMGSSGIRAGASNSRLSPQIDIDYLGPLWSGRSIAELVEATVAALRDMPHRAGFDVACERIGGGFSAWRLALQQDPEALVASLARIRADSGVAVLVVPQRMEGAYAHAAARQRLGAKLTSSHVLDIGGGSLQIAGAETAFAAPLGQKLWHRHLCRKIRGTDAVPCALQPLRGEELAAARELLAAQLKGIAAALPGPVTMTAISRPVTRGILPAIESLTGAPSGPNGLARSAISAAIERFSPLTMERMAAANGGRTAHSGYLLSDLLLVEGLMRAIGGEYLKVAEIDLTNLPGLLGDDRAFAWAGRYGCYLERLRKLGEAAYASDPAGCEGLPSGDVISPRR